MLELDTNSEGSLYLDSVPDCGNRTKREMASENAIDSYQGYKARNWGSAGSLELGSRVLESIVVTRCMQSVGHRCWASLLGIASKGSLLTGCQLNGTTLQPIYIHGLQGPYTKRRKLITSVKHQKDTVLDSLQYEYCILAPQGHGREHLELK
jgi:hypothetical protein